MKAIFFNLFIFEKMKKSLSQRFYYDNFCGLTTIESSIDLLFNTIKLFVPVQLSLFLSLDSNPWMHEHSYVAGWFVHFVRGPQILGVLHSSTSTTMNRG